MRNWYADGCNGLADLQEYLLNGLATDVASDLSSALDLFDAERVRIIAIVWDELAHEWSATVDRIVVRI